MPTTRPRHQVTETEELAAALDEAAVVRQGQRRSDRLEALQRHSGALTGDYPPGHLEDLREDWPE